MHSTVRLRAETLAEFVVDESRKKEDAEALNGYVQESSKAAFSVLTTEVAIQCESANRELVGHGELQFKIHLLENRIEFRHQAMTMVWLSEGILEIAYPGVETARTYWMPDAKEINGEIWWRQFDSSRQLLDDIWISNLQLADQSLKRLVELGLTKH
jgi:hypothetical protein